MGKKIVLIDGHSILNRAFYGVPNLTNSEGVHTNAVYGFLNILFKVLEEEGPEYLAVAFDVNQPTFRHEWYAEYKGTRKPMPEDLREQVPLVKEALQAMGVTILERPGYEADDVLGTLAGRAEAEGFEVSLVSGDKDLLQLATDKVKVRMPKTKFGTTTVEDYYAKDVVERYGLQPRQIIDLKGLMGDSSDNIPGVPGVGEKTATKILATFESVEEAIERVDEVQPNRARESIRQNKDLALLSKELATIKTDCELDVTFEQTKLGDLLTDEAYALFGRLEFKSLLGKFDVADKGNADVEGGFATLSSVDEVQDALKALETVRPQCVGVCTFYEEGKEGLLQDAGGQYSLFEDVDDKKSDAGPYYGFSFAYTDADGAGRAYYVPASDALTAEYASGQIRQWMEGGTIVAFPSIKNRLDILDVREDDAFFDVHVAAYLLNPLKDGYHVDDVARDYLGWTVPSYAERFGKKGMGAAYAESKEAFRQYACYEGLVAAMAYPVLKEALEKADMWTLYETIEAPLLFTLYEMEQRGVGVHREELKAYGERLGEGVQALEQAIYKQVGETFNINSPKQLGVVLFEKLHLPHAKKTKTGYSTSADVLEKLRLEDPVVSMVLEYRQLTKLKSTYADGLAAFIDESDGRIHGKFHQTITATGRISSAEPNLQNIPIRMELGREIRKVFVPKEGYVFLDADYSQIELRVLAHMSGDESLIQAYREDQDIHRITASKVFHTPLDEVTGEQRGNAKAVNFGIVYGISSFGLGQGLNISSKEAKEYIDKYFETYPKIKAFLDGLVEEAKQTGYGTTVFGRRRPIPELTSGNFMNRSFGERVAMNSPIQGTAADIIKIAMIRVNRRLKEMGVKSRLILQVHDELLVEAHRSEVEEVKKVLHDEMFHAAEMDVPLMVEVNEGDNWYEAK